MVPRSLTKTLNAIVLLRIQTHHVFSRLVVTHRTFSKDSDPSNKFRKENTVNSNSAFKKTPRFIPRKAAINIKPSARDFCKSLLQNAPTDVIGIILKYQMSSQGKFGMVFSFEFARQKDIGPDDEAVSLEVLEDGTPKPPSESQNDGLPKLYVHHSAFMKVLGGTLDVRFEENGSFIPIMYDREGNEMDPNE